MPREARRNFLSLYYCFDCNCRACEKDYPLLSELEISTNLPWRCLDCHEYLEGKDFFKFIFDELAGAARNILS